jgi:hypothetical protein
LDNAHGDIAKKKVLNKHSGLLVWWVKRRKPRNSCRYRNRLIMFAQINFANVRYWHKADISIMPVNVRFRGSKEDVARPCHNVRFFRQLCPGVRGSPMWRWLFTMLLKRS